MIYCSTVRQTLFSIKRNLKNKVKVFLPVLFLALFLFPVNVNAQSSSLTIDFSPFKCLFELTSTNCSPSDDETAIGRGEASGVIYGQTNTFTETGVTSITMRIGLQADLAKEKSEQKYFYSRVADKEGSSFFLRFKYLVPGTNTPLNYFIDVPYQKGNVQIQTGWIPSSVSVSTINTNTANGSAQTKIAFYKVGPNGYEVVTQQVLLAKATLEPGIELPYGAEVETELWYCGGAKDGTEPSSLEKEASATAFLALQNNPNISGDERNRLMAIVELGRNPVDGRYAPREEGRVEYFTKSGEYKDYLNRINGTTSTGIAYSENRCSGSDGIGAAYKIGTTRKFTLPANKAAAEASSQENLESGITASSYLGSTLPLCSITPFGDGSVMGCIAQILYGGVFRPVAFFAQVMGKLFDFFIGYSLSDESYRHDFVQTGWQLVRDISNIFFIIIMIYSGLAAVFSTSNVSYKKVIPTLIINALIINFSLFATRLVIDMSNITARIFYNQMVVKVDGQVAENTTGFKPISEAIVSSFNPQKIFEGKVLESEAVTEGTKQNESDPTTFNGQSDPSLANGGFKRYSKEYASYFALVTLVAIAISFGVAIMFWKTAFLFIGRVIGLYVAMIFSPFAFLSRGGVPLVSRLPALNFGSWWKDLSQYALLAPIFVFFLYIINSFLNVEFFTKVGLEQNGQGFFGSVMYVMIPMLIIYGLVTRGVKIAENLAGEYGKMAQSFANKATGFVGGAAVGVATGGLAFAGTRAAGLLKLSEAGRARLAVKKAEGGFRGRLASLQLGLNDKAQTGSFDVRKTKAFGGLNTVLGQGGVKLDDKMSSSVGLGSDATKGGMKAIEKEEKKKLKKKIESISTDMKDEAAKEFWEKKAAKLAAKEEQRLLNDKAALIAAHEASGKDAAKIAEMEANGTLKDGAAELAKNKIKSDFGEVSTNKQLTQALRIQFADTIANGKTFGQSTKARILKGLGAADIIALNPLATVPIAAMAYEGGRKGKVEKDEATSYAKKAREALNNKNKLPKEERLEGEKKVIEEELKSIDETLKNIFKEEIRTNPAHADKTEAHFFNNPVDASEVIKKARVKMKNDMDIMNIDIEDFEKEYRAATKSKDAAAIKTARESLALKYTERETLNQRYKESDPSLKQKKQADFSKKEDEIEKIKEKADKEKEKKSEDKK